MSISPWFEVEEKLALEKSVLFSHLKKDLEKIRLDTTIVETKASEMNSNLHSNCNSCLGLLFTSSHSLLCAAAERISWSRSSSVQSLKEQSSFRPIASAYSYPMNLVAHFWKPYEIIFQ